MIRDELYDVRCVNNVIINLYSLANTNLQHQSYHQIILALHVHLDARNYLNVLVVKGNSHENGKIADRLISTRSVKHGKLTKTTTADDLA
jgi:CopG family nickel-responsive transcriptional regulator